MTFLQRLRTVQRRNNSLLCIGLDPDLALLPPSLLGYADPIAEFNRRIIAATRDLVCAYKMNLAFYEATGERGWHTLHLTLGAVPSDVLTIGDGKRGDIGNSSAYYAREMAEEYKFSACTVNPYMGEDSVAPFLRHRQMGVFILAVTSNPGAQDFQYLRSGGRPVYEHVITRAQEWNTRKNCGLVVGATKPRELQRARLLAPTMPLLIPGIGAQGGDLRSAVRYGCDDRGDLAVINASRSIIYASRGADFADAARGAALDLRTRINEYRSQFFPR
jgi:orotidine-5'-phosphate decarboxylase